MIETKLNNLEINELTKKQFDSVKESGELNPIALYMTPSSESVITPISLGGTNAQTVQEARTNLGFEYGSEAPTHIPETGDGAIYFKIDNDNNDILPIEEGGTGAVTVEEIHQNLGQADYVVEQGTDGIWTYRKWNSGIAECWGRHSVTLNVNISWGSTYYGVASAIAFPSGLFKSSPKAEFQVENGNLWLATYAPVASATDAIYLISSGINNNCNAYIVIHALGNWK